MIGTLNSIIQVSTLYSQHSEATLTLDATSAQHTYRLNGSSQAVKFNASSFPDGGEVEIWNFVNSTVALSVVDSNGTQQSDKMFVAGDGKCTTCRIDKYGAVVVKLMDGRFYVSGNATVVNI